MGGGNKKKILIGKTSRLISRVVFQRGGGKKKKIALVSEKEPIQKEQERDSPVSGKSSYPNGEKKKKWAGDIKEERVPKHCSATDCRRSTSTS